MKRFARLWIASLGVSACPFEPETLDTAATDSDILFTPDTDTTDVSDTATPPPQACGDGRVDEGEACDDGNVVGGDGCTPTCGLPVSLLLAGRPKLAGEVAGDLAGFTVSSISDLDGDGKDEILVGAANHDGPSVGIVYLVRGPVTGQVGLGAADVQFVGGGSLGVSVATADFDQDGARDDVVMGSPGDGFGTIQLQHGEDLTFGAGPQQILLGSENTAWLSNFDAATRLVGLSVATPDRNGTAGDDLLLGAVDSDAGGDRTGSAQLVLDVGQFIGQRDLVATRWALFEGETAGDEAGVSVADAGDIDGDGLDDLVIGAHGNDQQDTDAGAAYVLVNPASGTSSLAFADLKLTGEAAGDRAGTRVAGAGDVDGDGRADLIVAAGGYATAERARAYVVYGATTPSGTRSLADAEAILTAEDPAGTPTPLVNGNVTFGASVEGAGDVDADGYSDLLVGAYMGGDPAGTVYLLYGRDVRGAISLATADVTIRGDGRPRVRRR